MSKFKNTMPYGASSAREHALLLLIRFSLLMLNHRADDEAIARLRRRCTALEDHLNHYQPSAWFLRTFGDGPAFHQGVLLSAVEDESGWHVSPLKGIEMEEAISA